MKREPSSDHIIDSAEIIKNIIANGEAINGEIERATAVEEGLSESIEELEEISNLDNYSKTKKMSVNEEYSNLLKYFINNYEKVIMEKKSEFEQ